MTAVAFDTLKFVKRLKEAGVPEKQAEAQAEAFAEAVDMNLATKQDIKDVKRDIADVKRDITSALDRLFLKLTGAVIGVAGLLKALDYLII